LPLPVYLHAQYLTYLVCRPVLDGLSATRQIRRLEDEKVLPYSVPIVAVSGNARSEWTERAQNAGMDGFLRKPYNRAELQELLGRWGPAEKPLVTN
jgi:two-component system sensor histidine kinase/response regulator